MRHEVEVDEAVPASWVDGGRVVALGEMLVVLVACPPRHAWLTATSCVRTCEGGGYGGCRECELGLARGARSRPVEPEVAPVVGVPRRRGHRPRVAGTLELGVWLRAERARRRLTLRGLARRLGLRSEWVLTRVETGKRPLDRELERRLRRFFRVRRG